jgi:XTP/dITP diphosphohydrolase
MQTLLIATTNRHKLEEFRVLFHDLSYELLSLNDIQLDMDVEETGTSFRENAELKARAYARATGLLTLAEDSGLEIDALGGAPGVYSARFLGADISYEERFRFIFEQLKCFPQERRTARFRCVIVIAESSGVCRYVDGTIEGVVTTEASGTNGFGYDPIFLVPELGKTTADMLPELKNTISHRAKAAQKAHMLLENWPKNLA